MANVTAVKSGNWSDVTTWNTGALPTAADDVFAGGFTVTVDINATVLTINPSGVFQPANGITLTCTGSATLSLPSLFLSSSLTSGQSATFDLRNISFTHAANFSGGIRNTSSGTFNILFNQYTMNTGNFSNIVGIQNSSSGTVNITGNINGGNTNGTNASVVQNSSTGTISIAGNVFGSSGTNTASGTVANTGGGNLIITGNISGGSGSYPVFNTNGTTTITGNCTGSVGTAVISFGGVINVTGSVTSTNTGSGVNNAGGTINITGTCTGGSSTGNAFVNSSTGTITHIGTAQASATAAAIGTGVAGQITILTGPLLSTDASYTGAASSGVNPCVALRWFPANTALSTFEYRMRGQTVAGSPSARPARQMFLTDAYDATYPTAANVRSGTAYGPSSIYTGTCAVPAAASVVVGAAVDNTVGTAAITAATIRNAVGLASANLDTQLSGITSGISGLPSASAIASAVWAAATRTLTTAIDNSSTIAAAVWSYATGRTITGGTVDTLVNSPSVPSAASIASQVRTELTPELARVANCATTQEVDDIVEGALS